MAARSSAAASFATGVTKTSTFRALRFSRTKLLELKVWQIGTFKDCIMEEQGKEEAVYKKKEAGARKSGCQLL